MVRWWGLRLFAIGTVLAMGIAACGGGDVTGDTEPEVDAGPEEASDEPEDDSVEADADEPAPEPDPAVGEPVGTLTFDGQTVELTGSYWCEPEAVDDFTKIQINVHAHDADGEVMISGTEALIGASEDLVHRVSFTGFGNEFVQSGDLSENDDSFPFVVVDGDRVTIDAPVLIAGGEIEVVQAEFTLPAESGAPGLC